MYRTMLAIGVTVFAVFAAFILWLSGILYLLPVVFKVKVTETVFIVSSVVACVITGAAFVLLTIRLWPSVRTHRIDRHSGFRTDAQSLKQK